MEIDCHAHCKIYHPKYFAGKITPFIDNHNKAFVFALQKLNPFSDNDAFDRLGHFLEYSDFSENEVIEKLVKQNPKSRFCIKIIDLSCMGAGNVKVSLIKQLYTLLRLKKDYPQLILFPVIDPRNKEIDSIYHVMSAHINEIGGFGFYPNIGYTLEDERLDRFFELLNDNKKSCIIHCTDTTPVYYKGNDLQKLIYPLRKYYFFKDSKSKKELCGNFGHPSFIVQRAIKYKNINFSAAHFGGENKSWRSYLINVIENHSNIFVDTSFTFETDSTQLEEYILNPRINRKILPGRDWYMNITENCTSNIASINKKLQKNVENWLRY